MSITLVKRRTENGRTCHAVLDLPNNPTPAMRAFANRILDEQLDALFKRTTCK